MKKVFISIIVLVLGLMLNRCTGGQFACASFLDYELRNYTLVKEVRHYYTKETNYNQLIIMEKQTHYKSLVTRIDKIRKANQIDIYVYSNDYKRVRIKHGKNEYIFEGKKAKQLIGWIKNETPQLNRFIEMIVNK